VSLRATTLLGAAVAAAALTFAGGSPSTAADTAGASAVPKGAEKLSDELKVSRWAYSVSLAPIRSRPRTDAKTVGKLRLRTELGGAESYLMLHRWTDKEGITWVQVRIPGRPNGRVGWVSRDSLGDIHKTTVSMELQRNKRRMLVRKNGKVVLRVPVGIGKPGTPTPAGRYWIRDRFHADGGVYGPRALGTAAYAPYLTDWPLGGIIGIHGTNQPQLVPGRPSHGCIRMKNKDVLRVYRIVQIGTPLHIR